MTAGSADGKLTPDCVETPVRTVGNPGRAGMGTAFIPDQKPIVLVDGEDWQGLYIDGKMMGQGHSLSAYDVIVALQTCGFSVCNGALDEDWLMNQGFLPTLIEDVKWNSKT